MKKTIYKGQSTQELSKALYEQREVLRNFRFGASGSKTRNVKEGHTAKKEIARIMTELNAHKQ
ncbi:50S ribosomal protein L29 [Candidatus Parcubacteria bacterium]|nr:50S ribosomal protein L29 [Candidatus Parcubacteria bacterium]